MYTHTHTLSCAHTEWHHKPHSANQTEEIQPKVHTCSNWNGFGKLSSQVQFSKKWSTKSSESLKTKLKGVLLLTLPEKSVRTVFSAFGFSAKCCGRGGKKVTKVVRGAGGDAGISPASASALLPLRCLSLMPQSRHKRLFWLNIPVGFSNIFMQHRFITQKKPTRFLKMH